MDLYIVVFLFYLPSLLSRERNSCRITFTPKSKPIHSFVDFLVLLTISVPQAHQSLFFNGQELDDFSTLHSNGIQNLSILKLKCEFPESLQDLHLPPPPDYHHMIWWVYGHDFTSPKVRYFLINPREIHRYYCNKNRLWSLDQLIKLDPVHQSSADNNSPFFVNYNGVSNNPCSRQVRPHDFISSFKDSLQQNYRMLS